MSENIYKKDINVTREGLFKNYYFENNSEEYPSLSNKKFMFFEKLAKNKLKFNITKKIIYSLLIFGFTFILGFLLFLFSNLNKITQE